MKHSHQRQWTTFPGMVTTKMPQLFCLTTTALIQILNNVSFLIRMILPRKQQHKNWR